MTYSSRNFLMSGGDGSDERTPRFSNRLSSGDDVVADLDALIADEHGRARDQLADVVLILVAERAAENLSLAVLLDHNSLKKPGLVGWPDTRVIDL